MKIRRARLEDVPQIIEIYQADPITGRRESREKPLPVIYFDAFRAIDADENQALLIAEDDEELLGTVQVTLIRHLMAQGLKRAVVEAVFVHPGAHRRGVGRALMEAALALAREQGCGSVELTSNKAREDAHAFYIRLGFTATHEGFKLTLSS